jgi:hypothetical protein
MNYPKEAFIADKDNPGWFILRQGCYNINGHGNLKVGQETSIGTIIELDSSRPNQWRVRV